MLPNADPFATVASNHGRWFLNEISVYSEDITPSPAYSKHWKLSIITTNTLGPKCIQEMVCKVFKNRKEWFRTSPTISNWVKWVLTSASDRSYTFQTITAVAQEVIKDEQRYLVIFCIHSQCLFGAFHRLRLICKLNKIGVYKTVIKPHTVVSTVGFGVLFSML